MRLKILSTLGVAAAMLVVASCTHLTEDGSVTVPMIGCTDEAAVWDNGQRLIDSGMHGKLELKGVQLAKFQELWANMGAADPADRVFLFKLPNNDSHIYIIVTYGPCVIHEEVVPADALMTLLTGRQSGGRGRAA